jgi:hypothetical protein
MMATYVPHVWEKQEGKIQAARIAGAMRESKINAKFITIKMPSQYPTLTLSPFLLGHS